MVAERKRRRQRLFLGMAVGGIIALITLGGLFWRQQRDNRLARQEDQALDAISYLEKSRNANF